MAIAYDFDGVLVPDMDHIPFITDQESFYKLFMYMKPTFYPSDYYIITARPAEYTYLTNEWCKHHLIEQPIDMLHSIELNQDPAVYKAQVLNNHPDINVYIESDNSIVQYLKHTVTTGCDIRLFNDHIAFNLNIK